MGSLSPSTTTLSFALSLLLYELVCFFWVCLELWIIVVKTTKKERKKDKSTGSFLGLMAVIGISSARALAHTSFLALPGTMQFHLIMGTSIMVLGIFLRISAMRTLGTYFRGVVVVQQNHKVVDYAEYAYIRHPSYAGALTAGIGLGIAMGTIPAVIVIALSFFIGLYFRIRYEEESLLLGIGTPYAEYMKRTWKLIPFVY